MTDRDHVDRHVERWLPILPTLDPDVEGAVTRIQFLTRHLREVKERTLVGLDLHGHEYDTLHALVRRGFVRRIPSTTDRRRVDVELTEAGRAAWHGAMDVRGAEEHRLLAALTPPERRLLSDLLRRVVLRAEQPRD